MAEKEGNKTVLVKLQLEGRKDPGKTTLFIFHLEVFQKDSVIIFSQSCRCMST